MIAFFCGHPSLFHHFLLKPQLEDAVGDEYPIFLNGNHLFVNECLFDAVDVRLAAQRIGVGDALGSEAGVDATTKEAEKVELIGGETLRLLYEEAVALLEQGTDAVLQSFLVYFFLCLRHHVPSQLLHIGRIVPYRLADSHGVFLGYVLAIFLKA